VLLAGRSFRRYEAGAFDADDVCFTFPIAVQRDKNFGVMYNITSDEILVHMNLRSTVDNRILRSRLLPSRFKQLYENCENLTESYEIEFCASAERVVDKGVSTPRAAILHVYPVPMSGLYPLMLCGSFVENKCCAVRFVLR